MNKIFCEGALSGVRGLESDSVNLVITSPPYFKQREYTDSPLEIGRDGSLEDYLKSLHEIFAECVRVCRDDGSIVFNLGDKYLDSSLSLIPHRFAIAAIDYGTKLINNITWVKTNPQPHQYDRRLIQSTEPFFHFVKSGNYKYDLNAIRGNPVCRFKPRPHTKMGQKYFKVIDDAELSDDEKDNAKTSLKQVIQEVKSGVIESFRMKIRGVHSLPYGGQEGGRKNQILNNGFTVIRIHGHEIQRDVISCSVETIRGIKHPAIFPTEIVEKFVKLTTHKDDVVLDPFMGSGTTAVVCQTLKRQYIGFEINPEFIEIAGERLSDGQTT